MEFLYPQFINPTHRIKNTIGISSNYPKLLSDNKKTDYDFKSDEVYGEGNGQKVSVIRENIGYDCQWSLVKAIGDNTNNEFYILSSNLINIGGKSTYQPICSDINIIDDAAIEINPYLKEIFLPYIDKKNGFYSVRIQIDYEKILDMKLFNKVLDEVYFEGVNLLLASRGFQSDNSTINNLKNKYYTFAYIHKDFDITVRRVCEPLTFTVSIPLNFFNDSLVVADVQSSKTVRLIEFTNFDFIDKIDNIIDILTNKIEDLNKTLYPDKVLENFVIDFELNSLRKFAVSLNEVLSSIGYPLSADQELTKYYVGLDNNLSLVEIRIEKNDNVIYVNSSVLSQIRMRGDINNKRVFNYFLNMQEMYDDLLLLEAIDFYKKYVKYPDTRLVDEEVTIAGIDLTAQQIKEFRVNFRSDAEACYKSSDLQKLYGNTLDLADPIYNLFVPNDPKNERNIPTLLTDLSGNISQVKNPASVQGADSNNTFQGLINFLPEGVSAISNTAQQQFKRDFLGDVNALAYILKRINIQEILFNRILCALKGTNPNAQEIASIYSQIPVSILNYYSYINTIQNLTGTAYLRALEKGISFDIGLFCGDELTYFLKGLANFIGAMSAGVNASLMFVKEIDATLQTGITGGEFRPENPYVAIINSVTKNLYTAIFDFLFDVVKDLLNDSCDDPLYDRSVDNFQDPFNTHTPTQNGNIQTNNDKNILRRNKEKAIEQTVPDIVREFQYGVDLQYTVDLIDLLINDIKCILTGSESYNLLKGTPSDEVIVIIKNIIRNKYSKDPNNLSYLLNEDKLKLLFKKLGMMVDQQILDSINDVINKIVPATICTPQQYQIRCELFKGKLPPELGILEKDTRDRVQNARKLIEKIKKGDTIKTISALCPDIEDQSILDLKGNLVKQYADSIRSILRGVLNTFTQEASTINKKLLEERNLYRKDGNTIFDKFPYYTVDSNLYKNLKIIDENNSIVDSTSEEYKKDNSYIVKYFNRNESELSDWELEDMFLKTKYINADIPKQCSGSSGIEYTPDNRFMQFLKEGRILWHNFPWARNRDVAEKEWRERGGAGAWESWFSTDLKKDYPELYDYIKEKKYVLFLNSENFLGQYDPKLQGSFFDVNFVNSYDQYVPILYNLLVNGEKDEIINYYLVKYSDVMQDFRILAFGKIESEATTFDSDLKELLKWVRIDVANYTGEVVSNLLLDNNIKYPNVPVKDFNEFDKKYYSNIKKFYKSNGDRRYTSHVLSEDFVNIININSTVDGASFEIRDGLPTPVGYTNQDVVLNILQSIVIKIYDETVTSIFLYDKIANTSKLYKERGLFNILTTYDKDKGTYERTVRVASTSNFEEKTIEYKKLYSVITDIEKYETIDINSSVFESAYEGLCKGFSYNKLFKNEFNINEIKFTTLDGKETTGSLGDRNFKVRKNEDYRNAAEEAVVSLLQLDLSSDVRYKNCNIFPHYLNLEYFLTQIINNASQKLCDTNLREVPKEMLLEIIVRMAIRVFVTDLLVKTLPFLEYLPDSELLTAHQNKFILDVIREHLRQEMNFYSSTFFDTFINTLNNLYKEGGYTYDNESLPFSQEDNKILDYLISVEIKRFIRFSLDKGIISTERKTYDSPDFFADIDRDNLILSNQSRKDLRKLSKNQLKTEFYNMLIYVLMAHTIDFNKRSIFNGTKSQIASIFFKNTNMASGTEQFTEKSQEDVVKFINDVSYSPNPAAMAYLYPDYSKYISFFIDASLAQTKSILLTSATQTELNMAITRGIVYGLTLTSTMVWSMIDQKERQKLMANASVNNYPMALLYDRFNKGMTPLPQQVISIAVGASSGNWPMLYGIPYLILDAIDEVKWLLQTTKDIENIKNTVLNDRDPCEVSVTEEYELICDVDLKNEINDYEEAPLKLSKDVNKNNT